VERLSDVDLAVELASKEVDFDRARLKNQQRAEELVNRGRRLRNILEWEVCWHLEAFKYLKGPSRVIALAGYSAEKTFVLAVPHRSLIWRAGTNRALPVPSLRVDSGVRAAVHSERTKGGSF